MNKKALLQQVEAATPEDRKLIECILTAPPNVKFSLLAALSEITKPTGRSKFLQYVLEAVLAVSQDKMPLSDRNLGFEEMVKAFTRPEALKLLAPTDPLAAARLKGVQVKQQLLYGDEQPLTSEEVASLLRMTRQAVDKRRLKGQLLGVSLGKRGYLYPCWQFQSGQVLPGLERVLAALKDCDPWTKLMFMKTGDVRLDGATPLERLQVGDIEAVVQAAESYGTHRAA